MTSQGHGSPGPDIGEEGLEPGTRVGDFVLEHELGGGTFGRVYRATHHMIGKTAAVKVLARRYSGDPQVVSRFLSEARAVNEIRHRNVVDIFDFGALPDGRPYFIMEYLDGEPLDECILRQSLLPYEDIVAIVHGLGRALDAAHAKGIIHRDLKPANVFVLREEGTTTPKLLDFGVAKIVEPPSWTEHQTQTGAAIGTPAYMSPEQCLGRDVDGRTDVYAFGVLSFRLLTGQLPFTADSAVELLMKHVGAPAPLASSLRAELPPEIDQALAAMLDKDPDKRPPSAGLAAESIETALVQAELVHPLARSSSGLSPLSGSLPPPDVQASALEATALSESSVPQSAAPVARPRRWVVPAVVGVAFGAGLGAWVWTSNAVDDPGPDELERSAPPAETVMEPAPTSPTVAPEPTSITIQVTGSPVGASVIAEDGQVLGNLPATIRVAYSNREVTWRVQARGYVTVEKSIIPDREQELAVELAPVPKAPKVKKTPKRRRPGRNDLEDPFQ